MVKKIVGYDDSGKKVFERDAREYDNFLSNKFSFKDIIKVIPIVVACCLFYFNMLNFQESQSRFNITVIQSINKNSDAIGGIKDVLSSLDSYLSSSTGRQFERGRPR